MTTLVLPGVPQPTERPRRGRDGRFFTPPRTREALRVARVELHWQFRHRPLEGPLAVELEFHLPGKAHGDWDNYSKLLCDAANGIIWRDDRQITRALVELHLESDDPRSVLSVSPR